MSLNNKQRRDQILARIYELGHVEVKELAAEIMVSEATVRRDLRTLADEGRLELVYGGATLPRASDFSFRTKATRNVEAKRVIGRLAADRVADADQVFLDSGTTCYEMAPHLRRKRGVSIIVNSARLAVDLGASPDLSVILIAGHYRPDRMDTVGPLAASTIDQLRGFRAFLGADGLSTDFGVTAGDIESAHLYRQVIRNAREAILVADHSKFLTPSLFKIAEWDAFSMVITDQRPNAQWLEFLNDKGIEVIYPKEEDAPGQPGDAPNGREVQSEMKT